MVVQFQPYTAYDIGVMRDVLATWCASRNIANDSDVGKDAALHILHMMAIERHPGAVTGATRNAMAEGLSLSPAGSATWFSRSRLV